MSAPKRADTRVERYIRQPAGLSKPGSYSHVSVTGKGRIVHLAGQVGLTEDGAVGGDGSVAAQVRQIYRNIGIALNAARAGLDDVVKTTVYLVGEENLEELMRARSEVFAEIYEDGPYPPNTLLIVARLANPALCVEVDVVAVVEEEEVANA